ncbi:Alcohol dehydrogenase 4 [Colletotrichum chlorophyti]|uniref:alcohol dehydrogenase n=1 Tax=Colletotrichum chlorophyti TaxID=708187 RepID=A0A1Q8RWW6_9PEZI|nr:Alcohol dehydrogenase 4 [Colletotrichum chlorophyti]
MSSNTCDSSFALGSGRAAVLRGPYGEPYKVEDNASKIKRLGPFDVLVRLRASGVCSGDISSRDGGPPSPPEPLRSLVGGHEGVGTVLSLGSSVGQVSDIKVGDVVGLGWRHSSCNKCEYCRIGAENLCRNQVVNGIQTDGTFQEFISAPVQHVLPIPESLDHISAAPLLCGGGTVVAALRRVKLSVGQWVAISGAAGGLGHLAIQFAKSMGAFVVAIDGGSADKADFCLSLGADAFLDFTQVSDMPAAVTKASKGGVHAAIVLSANNLSYVSKGLSLHGQRNATRKDILDALELAAAGKIKVVTEVLQLKDINTALDRLKEGSVKGRLVLTIP